MSRHANEFAWTEDATERLRKMCADGYTSGQIALAFGVSRNAVCGKIERLHLPRGVPTEDAKAAATVSQPAPRSRAKPRSEWKPRAPRKRPAFVIQHSEPTEPAPMPEMKAAVESNPVRMIEATNNQCRWVLDGYDVPTVCGAEGFPRISRRQHDHRWPAIYDEIRRGGAHFLYPSGRAVAVHRVRSRAPRGRLGLRS